MCSGTPSARCSSRRCRLAFERYGDPKIGGWLFAAFRLVTKVEPLKLASIAALGIALPLWLLALHVPLALVATIAGPLGLLVAGWLLQHAGLRPTFPVVAAGETGASLFFVALIARFRRAQAAQPAAVAVSDSSL